MPPKSSQRSRNRRIRASARSDGPTGPPSAAHVRPCTPYMTNADLSWSNRTALVAKKYQVRKRVGLVFDDRGRRVQILLGRPGGLVRGIANQACEAEQEQRDCRPDSGAQHPRRFAVQLELPPEVVRILYVLERE